MTTTRHRWAEPIRFEHKTERSCLNANCPIVKVTRHEGGEHWTEYWRGLDKLGNDAAPRCESEEQVVA